MAPPSVANISKGFRSMRILRNSVMARAAIPLIALTVTAASAQDAAVTDPNLYKVVFENDRVRVLEYRDQPGAKTSMHAHPAFLVYALSSFERRLTLPDGKVLNRTFSPGQILFSEAQTHMGENVGTTETHIIMVELK
ncbi:hypothetical protein [Acuticoccus kandeliae]|uniref:hypothetical protein n=1 Tax=Acuticoccus kandeliae TaxID=2073160 RepID=UPI00196A3654|nr:hypothetical protein [Acuticoccus kandeliae]